MPFFIVITAVQLGLLVHAMKTGRDRMWIYLLLLAPGIGAAAYFIVELMPDLLANRRIRSARHTASKIIDPNRDLRGAVEQLKRSDNVQNAMEVAALCNQRGDYAEAAELVQPKLRGVHEFDPDLMLQLAVAQFGLGQFEEVLETLDRLKAENPDYRSPDGHLLYARAKAEVGDVDAAVDEYEALCGYYYGPEPTIRFAELLAQHGHAGRASTLFESVIEESKVAGKLYSRRHAEWIKRARQGLLGLKVSE